MWGAKFSLTEQYVRDQKWARGKLELHRVLSFNRTYACKTYQKECLVMQVISVAFSLVHVGERGLGAGGSVLSHHGWACNTFASTFHGQACAFEQRNSGDRERRLRLDTLY